MEKLTNVIKFLQGKKTMIVGVCGVIYGLGTSNNEIIILSLGMMGLKLGQLGK